MDKDERDWTALALAFRIVLSGVKSRSSAFATTVEWFDDRLITRTAREWRGKIAEWEMGVGQPWFEENNLVVAMRKIGLEPTAANWRRIVNASRRLLDPKSTDI